MPRKLEIKGYSSEKVEHFKYLGAWVNENANSHKEIRERLIKTNRCYFELSTLFKSKVFSKRLKIILYKVLIKPVGMLTIRMRDVSNYQNL